MNDMDIRSVLKQDTSTGTQSCVSGGTDYRPRSHFIRYIDILLLYAFYLHSFDSKVFFLNFG